MRIQGCNDCAQTLGALVMPSNCDALLVTSQRMLPDGSIGVFAGDYQLTPADLQAIETWRNNCVQERQRLQDEARALQAIELAKQPITPGWAVYGPGSVPAQAPNVSLAVDYVESIQDPTLKQQAASAVVTAVQQNPTNPGAVTVTTPSGQVVTIAPNVSTVPGPGGGGAVIDAGFPDEMHTAQPAPTGGGNSMLALAAIAALALLG